MHIPLGSFSKLFAPVFKLTGYRPPSRVERGLETNEGMLTTTYCNISPKYPSTLLTIDGGKRRERGLKEMVDMVASSGHDLVVNALLKCKVAEDAQRHDSLLCVRCIGLYIFHAYFYIFITLCMDLANVSGFHIP
jgi:hypothetical protein